MTPFNPWGPQYQISFSFQAYKSLGQLLVDISIKSLVNNNTVLFHKYTVKSYTMKKYKSEAEK